MLSIALNVVVPTSVAMVKSKSRSATCISSPTLSANTSSAFCSNVISWTYTGPLYGDSNAPRRAASDVLAEITPCITVTGSSPVATLNTLLNASTRVPGPDEAVHGRTIAGEAWVLAERMLQAIGIAPDAAYLAALACFHSPGARLDKADLERCGAMARDHIRLAAPQRLILFGDAPARALLGQPLGDARGRIHRVEGIRTIATFHPRWLLKRASDKALAWRDLLLLMSEDG